MDRQSGPTGWQRRKVRFSWRIVTNSGGRHLGAKWARREGPDAAPPKLPISLPLQNPPCRRRLRRRGRGGGRIVSWMGFRRRCVPQRAELAVIFSGRGARDRADDRPFAHGCGESTTIHCRRPDDPAQGSERRKRRIGAPAHDELEPSGAHLMAVAFVAASAGVAGPLRAQNVGADCARLGDDDQPRPIPPDLVKQAASLFGLSAAPPDWVLRSTVYRCMGGAAWLCNSGANLTCAKADVSRVSDGRRALLSRFSRLGHRADGGHRPRNDLHLDVRRRKGADQGCPNRSIGAASSQASGSVSVNNGKRKWPANSAPGGGLRSIRSRMLT